MQKTRMKIKQTNRSDVGENSLLFLWRRFTRYIENVTLRGVILNGTSTRPFVKGESKKVKLTLQQAVEAYRVVRC
jgi:hypothetical protein